ncbi:hypothetical protein OTU49_016702 [Cherax quadricarinatus]|uniref:Carotenoid isomerooxygenase n=2 Tax=Cherax quadricarinatus TaxID=27406 RepID=A0AAW0Y6E1_CHEQU
MSRWAKRGRKEMLSESVIIKTSKVPTLEGRISGESDSSNRNERLASPESLSSVAPERSAGRGNRRLSDNFNINTRNSLYGSSNIAMSRVKNSFNLSDCSLMNPGSAPTLNTARDFNSESATSNTTGVDVLESAIPSTSGVGVLDSNHQDTEFKRNNFSRNSSSFQTSVQLRNKTCGNENMLTAWPSSQLDLVKRRSAEISELRHVLEDKIKGQNPRYSSLSSIINGSSGRRLKSELLTSNKRSSSVYGHLHRDNVRQEKDKVSSSCLQRNDYSVTSSAVRLRQDNKQPASSTSRNSQKLKYLMNDQKKSSPFSDKKINEPLLCQRCSSPINSSPRQVPQKNISYVENEETTSQDHTPIGSLGPKTSTSSDSTRHSEDTERVTSSGSAETGETRINYYPNCDPCIWIRSCTTEVTQPLSGVKTGVIPTWLRGALLRNGPGRIQVGEYQYNHVFDGSALLHRFHFSDGLVTYQNKFLESRSYLKDTRAQRIVVNYFGTRAHPDPCATIMQNITSKFTLEDHFTDNAQISLYPYGDGLYALTETPFIYRIDPDTLNTHEKVNLTNHIAVFTHTAHPHVDRDGTVYNIGQGVGPMGPKYHICMFPKNKIDSKGRVRTPFQRARVVASVAARWRLNPCYMHSFAITDNYWVLIEQPLVVSVSKILRVLIKHDALIDALQWWEKETKIHVVSRETGTVTNTQYVTETFFFLHTINAYEDSDHIVLDIASYKNAEMLQCMFVEALKNAAYDPTFAQMFRGRPKRWVLPLHPNKNAEPNANLISLPNTSCHARWAKKNLVYVTPELIVDIGCEVPRIHYDEHNGRHYRYFYAICSDVDHRSPGTLVKADVVNKTHLEWSEHNVYPSEPIFVPTPGAQREDDGVVLSALLRAKGLDQQVCILVLDACTFTEVGRVEFTAPGPVPKCLHGWWVQEGTLTVHTHKDTQKTNTKNKQGTSTKDKQGTNTEDKQGANTEDKQGTNTKDKQESNTEDKQGTNTKGKQGTNTKDKQGTSTKDTKGTKTFTRKRVA